MVLTLWLSMIATVGNHAQPCLIVPKSVLFVIPVPTRRCVANAIFRNPSVTQLPSIDDTVFCLTVMRLGFLSLLKHYWFIGQAVSVHIAICERAFDCMQL